MLASRKAVPVHRCQTAQCCSEWPKTYTRLPADRCSLPLQLQGQHGKCGQYTSYPDVFRQIYRRRGITGFYSGIIPEYAKVIPGVAIAFCSYEVSLEPSILQLVFGSWAVIVLVAVCAAFARAPQQQVWGAGNQACVCCALPACDATRSHIPHDYASMNLLLMGRVYCGA